MKNYLLKKNRGVKIQAKNTFFYKKQQPKVMFMYPLNSLESRNFLSQTFAGVSDKESPMNLNDIYNLNLDVQKANVSTSSLYAAPTRVGCSAVNQCR